MGRLRIRDSENVRWIDICQSEFYVRNASNTSWYRLLPSRGLYARHGGNNYWIQIGCTTDDPEGLCPDEFGGTPDGNGENGSGPGNDSSGGGNDSSGDNGSGGNGSVGGFNPNSPYAPGYGFDGSASGGNESGNGGSEIIDTGDGDLVILDPNGDVSTFDPGKDGNGNAGGGASGGGGNSSDGGPGTFDDPYKCPLTVSGRGYDVTEFYVDLGSVSGTVRMSYNIRDAKAAVVVYHGGRRVSSTGDSKVIGRGVQKFEFNAANAGGDGRVLVRVSAERGSVWDVMFECPTTEEKDGYGTPAEPATCRGSFQPTHGGGAGIHENVHTLGKGGRVVIEYQMWYQPDRMDIFYRGQVIASTNTHVMGEGRLVFNFSPVGNDTDIIVRIGSLDGTTSWAYIMTCPDEKGSTLDPKACGPDSATTSGGAGITDTYFSMEGQEAGPMAVRYQMWNIPDTCEVYQNGTLVATTTNPVAGENYLRWNYNPANGTQLRVRIIGPDNKTSWSFLLECPGGDPKISAGNVSVREGNANATSQMCFPVTLNKASAYPVSVDYSTSGGTAEGIVATARILATDEFNIPFIAVADDPSMGKLVMDGGFPKFYNEHWIEPLAAPTTDSVFNTWNRSADAEFYENNASTPSGSQAKAWTYNSSTSAISATINSNNFISFLSPTEWDTYTYECTVGSPDDDDDAVGVVVAFEREGSTNHAIMAMRNQGGVNFTGQGGNWQLFYIIDGSPSIALGGINVGSNSGRWSGKYSRIRVEREGDIIRVFCSPFNSTTVTAGSKLEVNLNSKPELARFKGTTRWGFCAQSQDKAYFKDILFEGIGMAPQFTYLKNAVKWMANPASPDPKKVLILSDQNTGAVYSLDNQSSSFGISVPKTVQSLGYQTTVTDIYSVPAWNAANVIPLSDLKQYAAIIFLGSKGDSTNHLRPESTSNFAQYVADGGGLMLITDHDVFQGSVNPIAKRFNAEFYTSADRSPVGVDSMIARHGDHVIWDGLDGKIIPAGGSEGGIRITEVKSDFKPKSGTVTFAPGEISKTVCIDIKGDDAVEPDETVNIIISNPIGGEIQTANGVGTIINDDSVLCRQNPTEPVYERSGGPNGSYLMHVQPEFNCAAGNTMYLMMRDFNFANSGPHVFSFLVDDDFEFYIDCKKVATGTIGAVRTVSINVEAGLRNLILRYSNAPACTPSYAGMSVSYNGNVVMVTRAADWKGQANVIGELEGNPVTPTPVIPPTCNSTPEICQVYSELFNRLPDEAGAQFWLNEIAIAGFDVKTPSGYEAFKSKVRISASKSDCEYMGGTFDAVNNRCII